MTGAGVRQTPPPPRSLWVFCPQDWKAGNVQQVAKLWKFIDPKHRSLRKTSEKFLTLKLAYIRSPLAPLTPLVNIFLKVSAGFTKINFKGPKLIAEWRAHKTVVYMCIPLHRLDWAVDKIFIRKRHLVLSRLLSRLLSNEIHANRSSILHKWVLDIGHTFTWKPWKFRSSTNKLSMEESKLKLIEPQLIDRIASNRLYGFRRLQIVSVMIKIKLQEFCM
jgi:hypothetical protein